MSVKTNHFRERKILKEQPTVFLLENVNMLPAHDFKNKQVRTLAFPSGAIKVKIIFIFVVLLTSLVFTQLVFANNLATDGEKLAQVQSQISLLENENTTLKAEIAKASSLTGLHTKAQDLGFKKPSELTIL